MCAYTRNLSARYEKTFSYIQLNCNCIINYICLTWKMLNLLKYIIVYITVSIFLYTKKNVLRTQINCVQYIWSTSSELQISRCRESVIDWLIYGFTNNICDTFEQQADRHVFFFFESVKTARSICICLVTSLQKLFQTPLDTAIKENTTPD